MLSEEADSESEISEIDVLDEASDMEEGCRSMHDDDSGDDNVRSEGSEEESTDNSNEQGTGYSITVNARLILLHIESGPSGSRAGVGRGCSRDFQRGLQLGWFENHAVCRLSPSHLSRNPFSQQSLPQPQRPIGQPSSLWPWSHIS